MNKKMKIAIGIILSICFILGYFIGLYRLSKAEVIEQEVPIYKILEEGQKRYEESIKE